jgi:hypothetical protein
MDGIVGVTPKKGDQANHTKTCFAASGMELVYRGVYVIIAAALLLQVLFGTKYLEVGTHVMVWLYAIVIMMLAGDAYYYKKYGWVKKVMCGTTTEEEVTPTKGSLSHLLDFVISVLSHITTHGVFDFFHLELIWSALDALVTAVSVCKKQVLKSIKVIYESAGLMFTVRNRQQILLGLTYTASHHYLFCLLA